MYIGSLPTGKVSKGSLLALIAPVSFFITLGFFSWALYRDNYYTMFDLGLAYRSSYLFISLHRLVNYPAHFFVSGTLNQKFFYIPLSFTLLINNSPATILLDQLFTIAIGGYAIFHISRHFGLNAKLSVLNQVIYFLYPAVYGYLTHGGNFQVYFLGLFLCTYLFYLKNSKLGYGIFAILSAITNVLSPIYLLAFFAWILIIKITKKDITRGNHQNKGRDLLKREIYFITVPLIIWAVLVSVEIFQNGHYLLLGNLQGRYVPSSPSAIGETGPLGIVNSLFNAFGLNYKMKIWFFTDMLDPFLFTSMLSFSFPFILLYFVSISYLNYPGFFSILQQYPYAVMPFIFIGWISFQSRIMRSAKQYNIKSGTIGKIKKIIFMLKKNGNGIAFIITFLVLISSTLSFLTFSPFSIQNIENGQMKQEMYYSPLEKELNYMYSLVPRNSIVFIQNDVPQLSGEARIYMPGFGTYHNQTVDYAVFNPLRYNSITTPFNGFSEKWAYYFSTNSSYGVYASVDGSVLYKLGYMGQPVYYVPINTITLHGFTLGLEPNVTTPSPALSQFFSPTAMFEVLFHMNATSPFLQNTFRLLVESSNHSFSLNSSLKISRVPNQKHSYILNGNVTVPYFDEWSFYLLGNAGSYSNVTLISGNIRELNPL